jgi:hypothetical protein
MTARYGYVLDTPSKHIHGVSEKKQIRINRKLGPYVLGHNKPTTIRLSPVYVPTCHQRGADRERRDGVGGARSAATARSCRLARWRGGAADRCDGEMEKGATVRQEGESLCDGASA